MSGRDFDVQVVHTPPDSSRGQLMQKYVLARVMSMEGINLALYDYDRHNALYYFAVSPDEDIYLRYGGRDSESQDTYLDFDSLELALEQGLEKHQRFLAGTLNARAKPEPSFPEDIPGVSEFILARKRCVECHHLAHFQSMELERTGELDKLRDMYRSPDLKHLGLFLDVPKGLVIGETNGAAAESGLQAGDKVVSIESEPVLTFGDLQYFLDQVDREATQVSLGIERGGETKLIDLQLPELWWKTDLAHRYWTVEPLVHFDAEPLTEDEKSEWELPTSGFASRITNVPMTAMLQSAHELEEGDIVFSVNGVEVCEISNELALHIKLNITSGDTVTLGVIRDGERIELPLTTTRQEFRKLD
ncbi:MAG: Trx7/PDZ domain-containing (seleno)protein [Verrucomicrobiota bacterium]